MRIIDADSEYNQLRGRGAEELVRVSYKIINACASDAGIHYRSAANRRQQRCVLYMRITPHRCEPHEVLLSCITSQPRSMASVMPAPYSAGLPLSRNKNGPLIKLDKDVPVLHRLDRCWRFP